MDLAKKVGRWDLIEVGGALLLGGGIWAEWGPEWASMFWGALLLGLAQVRAVRMGRARPGDRA